MPVTPAQPPSPSGSGASARPRRGRRAGLAAAGVAVGLAALYGAGYALTGTTLAPRTTIAGVDVGGLDATAATARLESALKEKAAAPVTLAAGDVSVKKTPAELGLAIDYAASVERAGGVPTLNPVEMLTRLGGGHAYPPVVTADTAKLSAELAKVAASDRLPTDATLAYKGTTPAVVPGKNGQALKTAEAADAVVAAWPADGPVSLPVTVTPPAITTEEAQQALDTVAKPAVAKPVTLKAGDKTAPLAPDAIAAALTFVPADGELKPVLDPAKLAERAKGSLAGLGAKEPVDATIKISGGKPVVVDSVDGYGTEPKALAAAVLPALTSADRTAAVTLASVKASFDTAAAKNLGVKEVIGEFTTVFPGAYPYRYVNIPKASGMLNNTLLKPGEVFSMNDALGGQRTAEKGWAAGFGISGGKEVVTVGGALSQVTTTTYNAVFFSGLEDIEHKPHSLYFSRYPKGREATLSYPGVDMKFRNDSPNGVLIQTSWTGHVGVQGTFTVKLWGTKRYDVKQANTRITNQVTVSSMTPTKDNSPTCVAQDAVDGFDIRYDRQFYSGGKLVKSTPYFWHYNTLLPTTCTNPIAIQAAKDRTAS